MSLTINTNLASLLLQSNFKTSTKSLNQIIERMTTGYKINHAKDNAANFSIATDMSTKINAYQVAEDNCAMGLDLVNTASEILDEINNRIERLRTLQMAVNNETYGVASVQTINDECNAIVDEINRLYSTAEYNGVALFVSTRNSEGGTSVVVKETEASLTTTFKDIGVGESSFEIYDSNDNLIQAYDTESTDTIQDFFLVLQNHGFTTKLSNGRIEITSAANSYISGELANKLEIQTKENLNVSYTTKTDTIWSTTTSSSTHTETIWSTKTSSTTQTSTVYVTKTVSSTTSRMTPMVSVTARDTSGMTSLASVDETVELTSGTYSISTADELAKLATMTNNGLIGSSCEFVLANDIDLSAYSTGEGWTPIGMYNSANSSTTFSATFDGNGYLISNLYINRQNAINQGLFGNTKGADIKNVGLADVYIDAYNQRGALVGYASNTNITNCCAVGQITTSSGGIVSGGLVGSFSDGTITNCYTSISIPRTSSYSGGIVGFTNGTVTIANTYALGSISGTSYVGGLVGIVEKKINITNCYVYSSHIGGSRNVGGLIGHTGEGNTNITVENAYFVDTSGQTNGMGTQRGSLTGTINCITTTELDSLVAEGTLSDYNYLAYTTIYTTTTSSTTKTETVWSTTTSSTTKTNTIYTTTTSSATNTTTFWTTTTISTTQTSARKTYQEDIKGIYAPGIINLQIGAGNALESTLVVNVEYQLQDVNEFRQMGLDGNDYLTKLDELIASISARQVEFGAVQNRLESALESIAVSYDNLVSARSTIQDADVAHESSNFVKVQILQQASATLMATANQSPSIALQLI